LQEWATTTIKTSSLKKNNDNTTENEKQPYVEKAKNAKDKIQKRKISIVITDKFLYNFCTKISSDTGTEELYQLSGTQDKYYRRTST
jgi:hypothetical protein